MKKYLILLAIALIIGIDLWLEGHLSFIVLIIASLAFAYYVDRIEL